MQARTVVFATVLLMTMLVSNLSFFILVVASSELEAEFGLSNLQLGLLGTASTLAGALLSPLAGRITDRIGAVRAMQIVLISAAIGALATALAGTYEFVLFGMLLSGIPVGLSNPATNRAIAVSGAGELRGVITGVKQSGVQMAVFVSGFIVPLMTAAWGWRSGQWAMVGLSLALLISLPVIPPDEGNPAARLDGSNTKAAEEPHSKLAIRTAIYGALLGIIGGGFGRFIPLYAEEVLNMSLASAGRIFGVTGLVAIPVRILSGIAIDRGLSARLTLLVMALVGVVSVALIWVAEPGPNAAIWAGAILSGMTLGSWNTAANIIMIREPNSGKATGLLYLGFLGGLAAGGPIVGWSIDIFDSYQPAWLFCGALAAAGAAVVAGRDPQARTS